MIKYVDFKDLYIGTINVNVYNPISVSINSRCYRHKSQGMPHRAYLSSDMEWADECIKTKILRYMSAYVVDVKTLWIAPECRIRRDIFRQSGYKIVLDREKADRIVIPEIIRKHPIFYYDYAFIRDGILHLFTVKINDKDVDEAIVQCPDVADRLAVYFPNATVLTPEVKRSVCTLLKPIEIYKDIIEGTVNGSSCIEETRIPLQCPYTICPETLDIWRRNNDDEQVAKAIAASDWFKYPMTMSIFITKECYLDRQSGGGEAFNLVLDKLGIYDNTRYDNPFPSTGTVSAEDLAMAQSYAYYRMGIEEKPGYIGQNTLEKAGYWRRFVRRAFVVSPMKIDCDQSYENVLSLFGHV